MTVKTYFASTCSDRLLHTEPACLFPFPSMQGRIPRLNSALAQGARLRSHGKVETKKCLCLLSGGLSAG